MLLLLSLALPGALGTCGHPSCPQWGDSSGISVHLVAHSHDDVGWLKTVDQYYQGSNRAGWDGWEENQRAGVQYTLDTVVTELAMDPQKRFIQVETAFFLRWWRRQGEEERRLVRGLVEQGQLEFVGGGWSMNDEGSTHYSAVLQQMGLGHRLLNDTFGPCGLPKVAWQIDPFGHSKEQASLFAGLGMDGLFFGRLDWRDKNDRVRDGRLEMVWEASKDLGKEGDLFTGVLYEHYGPPPGFCWDLLCNDQPLMEEKEEGMEGNMGEMVEDFLGKVREQAQHFRTNHVMLTMGMDFHYQAAHSWFLNMDRLIRHVNQMGEGIELSYSTPSCYLHALHSSNISWPTKQDDFFPYASDPHAYWTGYFSSRPSSKFMIRQTEKLSLVFGQMASFTKATEDTMEGLEELQRTVGIVQHHDAATGTERQHVCDDYSRRMAEGVEGGARGVGLTPAYSTLQEAASHHPAPHAGHLTYLCPLLNISQCPPTEHVLLDTPLQFSLYSPLTHTTNQHIRIPVSPGSYMVTKGDEEVESQLVPLPTQVVGIPGRQSSATQELVFLAASLNPLALTHFKLTKMGETQEEVEEPMEEEEFLLGREGGVQVMGIKSSPLLRLVNSRTGVDIQLDMDLLYYRGHRGNNSQFDFRASGAYIFRPQPGGAVSLGEHRDTVITGPVVDELVRTYIGAEGWSRLTLRNYHYNSALEVSWLVGPIPVEDGVGKEVILRLTSDIASGDEFLTDSLGRQMVARVRDYRPTYEINQTEPESANYYPVAAAIQIQGATAQLALLPDRPQGGSSLAPGSLELMLHRRLLDDDAFGVGEPLNEEAYGQGLVVAGRHQIVLSSDLESMAADRRLAALQMYFSPLLLLGPPPPLPSCLAAPLPHQLHLLSVQPVQREEDPSASFLLLHLEHIFQQDEHGELSQPVTIDLATTFSCLTVTWAKETVIGGARWRQDTTRLAFHKEDKEDREEEVEDNEDRWGLGEDQASLVVTIKPMEIRAFLLKVLY